MDNNFLLTAGPTSPLGGCQAGGGRPGQKLQHPGLRARVCGPA